MTDRLIVRIEKPSDELRMALDDFLSLWSDGQCDSWRYDVQPSQPVRLESIRAHVPLHELLVVA